MSDLTKPDTRQCRDCIYAVKLTRHGTACYYIMYRGKRRPCPGGAECTVRRTKGGKTALSIAAVREAMRKGVI